MIKYLLQHRISVITITSVLIALSVLSLQNVPVSLLPDIDVPRIRIIITAPNSSSEAIEENYLKPLRSSMVTLTGLSSLESTADTEIGNLDLQFSFDTNMDLAYVDANEKLDRLLPQFPDNIARPLVIQINPTDIPIARIQVIPDESSGLVSVSQLTINVLKRRLEQLPGISLVDIHGVKEQRIEISPKIDQLQLLGIELAQITELISKNNIKIGGVSVRDGQYRYFVQIENTLEDLDDLRNMRLQIAPDNGVKLSQLAEIKLVQTPDLGLHTFNGKEAIVISIHKQLSAKMNELNTSLKETISIFEQDYEGVAFALTQNQTNLLNLSISNLQNSILIGGAFAFVVLFLFMGNYRHSLIMGISIPISLILTFLLFWVLDLSINIITLSGLALGIGMLIDNGIIVIDNITRHTEEGMSVFQACQKGVYDVMSALISSVLTTLAVFIPLIFLGGISGALFKDQALAIVAILSISLLVSFIILPVIYSLLNKNIQKARSNSKTFEKFKAIYLKTYEQFNRSSYWFSIICYVLFMFLGLWSFNQLRIEGIPPLPTNNKLIEIEWNENLLVEENRTRVDELLNTLILINSEADIGILQFLKSTDLQKIDQVNLYISTEDPDLESKLSSYFRRYSQATYVLRNAPNAFDQIFGNTDNSLKIKLRGSTELDKENELLREVKTTYEIIEHENFKRRDFIRLDVNEDLIRLYDISYQSIITYLELLFKEDLITELDQFSYSTPIVLKNNYSNFTELINNYKITSENGVQYPLSSFLSVSFDQQKSVITADRKGPYLSFSLNDFLSIESAKNNLSTLASKYNYLIDYEGGWLENREQVSRLYLIFIIAVGLLYFILVAQFESFIQPIVILLILPFSLMGSFIFLWLFGTSLNVMSGIGIVIMLGIIVNDSILKIDTINQLYKHGANLNQAIKEAGVIRLKPILMTTLTTILAVLPITFASGLGAELQKPLVYAVIGGLIFGTFAAIYLIPTIFKLLVSPSKPRS